MSAQFYPLKFLQATFKSLFLADLQCLSVDFDRHSQQKVSHSPGSLEITLPNFCCPSGAAWQPALHFNADNPIIKS